MFSHSINDHLVMVCRCLAGFIKLIFSCAKAGTDMHYEVMWVCPSEKTATHVSGVVAHGCGHQASCEHQLTPVHGIHQVHVFPGVFTMSITMHSTVSKSVKECINNLYLQ